MEYTEVKKQWSLRNAEFSESIVDILIDKSVIEVYANKRQAICRRVYPTDPKNAAGVRLLGNAPEKLDTYKMFPTNPY